MGRSVAAAVSVDQLVRFTDEELLLLGAEHPVVDTPYLSTLDAAGRRVATQVAYRSLCSHGAVAVDEGAGLEVPDPVVAMLRARSAAATVLLVSRATPQAGVFRYQHLHGDEVVVEDVTDAGLHEFGVIERGQLATELRDFCGVAEAVPGRGEPVVCSERSFVSDALGRRAWGEAMAQFDATVWRPSTPSVAGIAADRSRSFVFGTRGTWCGRREAMGDGPPGESVIRLTPVDPGAVPSIILAELLADAQPVPPVAECPLMRV